MAEVTTVKIARITERYEGVNNVSPVPKYKELKTKTQILKKPK